MCTLLSDFPAGSHSDSDLLKGLLTDNFCHVCEATLIHESQRVSHYEVSVSSFSVSSLSQKGCSHISNTAFYATRGKSMHKESGCTWTTKLKWTWRAKTVEAYWYVTDHTEYACIAFKCVLACFNSSYFVLFWYREVCLLRSSASCAAWCSAPPPWPSHIMRAKFMPRTWEKTILHLLEVSQIQTGICWVWLFTIVGKTSHKRLSNDSTFSARPGIHISSCPPISECRTKPDQSGAERYFWFGRSRGWPRWPQQVLCAVQRFLQQPSGCSAALQRQEASAEPGPNWDAGPDGGTVRTW